MYMLLASSTFTDICFCVFFYVFFFNAIGKPLFLLIDTMLRSSLSAALFDRVRTAETVRSVLEGGIYQNAARVDDELVRIDNCSVYWRRK